MLRFSKPSAELIKDGRPAGPRIVWAAQGRVCRGALPASEASVACAAFTMPEVTEALTEKVKRVNDLYYCRPICGLALFSAPSNLRAIRFTTFSSLSPLSSFLYHRCNLLSIIMQIHLRVVALSACL
jgi:hypothetical protein